MNTPQPAPKATLSKAERIKSLKTIDELFKNGSSFFFHPLKIIYRQSPSPETASIAAFMVSKRNFKRSVDRNRIKRMMRESWRLLGKSLIPLTHQPLEVIFIYTAQHMPHQKEINLSLTKAIQKIGSKSPV